jgi:hypoxanthine-DNA glycosylase
MSRITSFEPLIDQQSKVLILGSIPGAQSLKKQQYYGNPRNHFWPMMYKLFDEKPASTYEEKILFLQRHGIALWDVIQSCNREGSLDARITDPVVNPILQLLQRFSSISLIALNGTKAFTLFRKHAAHQLTGLPYVKLPSTSPVPGKHVKSLEDKLQEWKIIKEYI